MALLSIEQAPVTGLDDVTFVAADAGGDDVPTGPGVAFLVKNDDTVTHTATVDTPGTVRDLAIENPDVDVPADGLGVMPMITSLFGNPASVTYDDVTSVTVAVVQLAR